MLLNKANKLKKLIPYCPDQSQRITTFDALKEKNSAVIAAWIDATEARGQRLFGAARGAERGSVRRGESE